MIILWQGCIPWLAMYCSMAVLIVYFLQLLYQQILALSILLLIPKSCFLRINHLLSVKPAWNHYRKKTIGRWKSQTKITLGCSGRYNPLGVYIASMGTDWSVTDDSNLGGINELNFKMMAKSTTINNKNSQDIHCYNIIVCKCLSCSYIFSVGFSVHYKIKQGNL